MKLILAGSSGYIGQGILTSCLRNECVSEILIINRKKSNINHPKLKELVVSSLFQMEKYENEIKGFDACIYCVKVKSSGLSEKEYMQKTYHTTIHFAHRIHVCNPAVVFNFLSEYASDNSEKSKIKERRIFGKIENSLKRLSFNKLFIYRSMFLLPPDLEKNISLSRKTGYAVVSFLFPNKSLKINELCDVMITVSAGEDYTSQTFDTLAIKSFIKLDYRADLIPLI